MNTLFNFLLPPGVSAGLPQQPQLPYDYEQFMRFHERLAGPAYATTKFDYAFYTDDMAKLAAAHERQRARRAADPTWRQGKRETFDPSSRGHARSHLTPDEAWLKTIVDNVPLNATSVTLRINEADGVGVQNASFVRPRALFADADSPAACTGLHAFVTRTGLLPTMIVQSSSPGKKHLYWVLDDSFTKWDRWSSMQAALAAECGSDASLDDPSQAMRVPGTLNLKDPKNPLPVQLLYADGPSYTFGDFVRRSGLTPKPRNKPGVERSDALRDVNGKPVKFNPAIATRQGRHPSLLRNFTAGVHDAVDVRAASSICPALAETFATGGALHHEPLWFLMLALAVFDNDPKACAIAMSRGYPGYSEGETMAKLEQRLDNRDQHDLGWVSCRQISAHHPSCASCYYRGGAVSPLAIHANTVKEAKP